MVDSNGLDAVNVRIPEELLRIIDGLVDKGMFSSRAEAIREFLREYALESRTTTNPDLSQARNDKPSVVEDKRAVQKEASRQRSVHK